MTRWLPALLLLALAAPVGAAAHKLICAAVTEESAHWRFYACPVEMEPGSTRTLDFRVDGLTQTPSVSIRGDYTHYAGSAGAGIRCITWQQTFVREDLSTVRIKLYSACDEDKYLIVELGVPK